jgi:pimeloyl-ACP methyl ester carboxylesterase
MAKAIVNGVELFYEISGAGDIPLVVVHGSWSSHHNWDRVVPGLAESFRVLAYDRRGHSQSARPTGQGSVREDVADLAALIEHAGLAPTWVAGNSFGASITLRLAVERPDLFRGLIVHEPPLFGLLRDDPTVAPALDGVRKKITSVVERIAREDAAGAAEQFVETIAFGPGAWMTLRPEMRHTFIDNAPTYLDEARDPEQIEFDLERIKAFTRPALLTTGDQSPPMFAPVVALLAGAIRGSETHTFHGAGHIPQTTHPQMYVERVVAFIRRHST